MTPSKSPYSGAKMQILTFVNQKGGCGKTTTAINLAGALVARGERVLVVDLDPQAHATMGLGVDSSEGATVAEVLMDEAYIEQAIRELASGMHLLPARPRLAEFEERSERLIHPEQRLRIALDAVRDRYDYVIVDCPPRADGVLCANAMFACTTAVLVVETGAFALQGVLQALKVLQEVGENQGRSYPIRVVGTLFDRRTRFARELLVALHTRFGAAMFNTVIRTSVRLREAPALGVTVDVLDPQSRATADFASLAAEVCTVLAPEAPASHLHAGAETNIPWTVETSELGSESHR
ncbi:MAG TPA: ParA family protein [Planctomycetota bacterium]|nr:ParA family protein [Planctomycetota bacterium]